MPTAPATPRQRRVDRRTCRSRTASRRTPTTQDYVTFEVPADAADNLVLLDALNFLEETYEIELH